MQVVIWFAVHKAAFLLSFFFAKMKKKMHKEKVILGGLAGVSDGAPRRPWSFTAFFLSQVEVLPWVSSKVVQSWFSLINATFSIQLRVYKNLPEVEKEEWPNGMQGIVNLQICAVEFELHPRLLQLHYIFLMNSFILY
eukprot:TRINITY_DN3311_c0_g1_i2.p2 TRINITY_DN3311_c0_g1~~TRINITY_DN3311_c0_g1_i2.p2  ORF type:complete len:138 (-),score=1.18 TRINITY_DN3311_c0_g1_i2:112-525(-)